MPGGRRIFQVEWMVSRTSSSGSLSSLAVVAGEGDEGGAAGADVVAGAEVAGMVLGAGTSGAPLPSRNSPQYRHLMAPALMVSRQ